MVDRYDEIGTGYQQTRRADPRLTTALASALELEPPAQLADVGAGTGNYSRALADRGFSVAAVEPSEVMRRQVRKHPRVRWMTGYAESLPLDDDAVDGVVCTLALHHFQDREQALREMRRVVRPGGGLAIFTQDIRLVEPDSWLLHYFEPLLERDYARFPPIDALVAKVATIFEQPAAAVPFPLPRDLTDGFFAAAWARPERYLDATFRAGISLLMQSAPEMVDPCIERLRTDLASGAWDRRYGALRSLSHGDFGYRLVRLQVSSGRPRSA